MNERRIEGLEFGKRLILAFDTDKPAEIARRLGITYQGAKNYLDGRIPAPDTLVEMSAVTGYSIDWLLTGKGPAQVSEKNGSKLPLPSPETKQPGLEPGSVEKVLLAHMQLIAEQNNRIIGLLETLIEQKQQ